MESKEIVKNIKQVFKSFVKIAKTTISRSVEIAKQIIPLYSSLSQESKKRIVSGVAFVVVMIAMASIGGIVYLLFIAVLASLMIFELSKMLAKIDNSKDGKDIKLANQIRKYGLLYILICCISMVAIRENQQGLKATIWMYLLVWSTDTFALIFGKKFGKIKLSPEISPNKTYEGAILGSAAALVVSIIVNKLFNTGTEEAMSLDWFIIWSIVFIILSQFGDLLESFVKRKCGVKDSGTLIPGHGGVLDRFDSMLIVAPVMFLLFLLNGGIIF